MDSYHLQELTQVERTEQGKGATALRAALHEPGFDRGLVGEELPTPEHRNALVLVRSGDCSRHLRCCREYAIAEDKPTDPACGALPSLLLRASRAQELLTLTDNALLESEALFTNSNELAWFRSLRRSATAGHRD